MHPDLSRIGDWYHGYVKLVDEPDLAEAWSRHTDAFLDFFENIPPEKYDYRYAAGKWTIREVLQHIIDAERIFAYRALRFARLDDTHLPGFDENKYADQAKAHTRPWEKLIEEFKVVRHSSVLLFSSFDEEQFEASGVASGSRCYVRGIGYIIIGHSLHHLRVTRERYF